MSKRGLGMRLSVGALMLCCAAVLAGCATSDVLPRGEPAYALIGDPEKGPLPVTDYRISPSDTISITVFQEPDLSLKEAVVEASGNISMPLIGSVQAAGLTTAQLASDLEQRLGARYLEMPQVSVIVNVAVSQQVTVEGNVIQPGSYPLGGRMTLLRALALAHGPTRVAALDEVVVFRMVGGKRMGGLFDVNAIRKGQASDPQIEGNDMVVVGFNAVKGAYRDFLQTAPFLNVFRNF
ncbi:polysaccharide biosynthesis/export family protein [Sphingobium sp. CECT 9361]|uniref:polysaccharide biosynthesis/export family protein n=1 Tax=Sphingobium sp. CECT 9361 TaxID=2845384 RepID=UPI001E2A5D3F|nr:polysaccharide biosynthesis/export family protein [Sphingobium sp. CECT 9361]